MRSPTPTPTPSPVPDAPLRVTALASNGDGIARLDSGRVVFVEGGVPGDLVELGDLSERRKTLHARIARVVGASPDRVEPACPVFGRCGGCLWQHVRYSAQLEAKRAIVRAALERIGWLALPGEIGIVASPDAYHYRTRTRVVEVPGGIGYRRRGSNDAIRVEDCPVLVPAARAALSSHAARVASEPAEPGRPPREWVITAGSRGPARVFPADGTDGVDGADGTDRAGERAGHDAPAHDAPLELEVLGERLRVGGAGFVQGNALLWEALARTVRDRCLDPSAGRAPARFVELFAGIGFFTLALARSGLVGLAVESDRRAVADLEHNLARAGFAGAVRAIAARVDGRAGISTWLDGADLLLVDPPRVGLEGPVRDAISARGPRVVVYVSCDPATLARDLRALAARDYRVASVVAFDLFPQTPHVETVVRLER